MENGTLYSRGSELTIRCISFRSYALYPNFGDAPYIIVGTITLVSCIAYNIFAKSFYKQLSVLFGLIVGYVVAYFMGMVWYVLLRDKQRKPH